MSNVRVLKPFTEARTPCPPAGTVGRVVGRNDGFQVVRFDLPMRTTAGTTVLPHDEKTYLDLYFKPDEVEAV